MTNLVLHKIELQSSLEKNTQAMSAVKTEHNDFDLNKIFPLNNQYDPNEACAYWGVKRNSEETVTNDNCIYFNSAIESPTKLIALFAAQHQLDMTVYAQEESREFWHKHVYKNGILVEMSGGVVGQLKLEKVDEKVKASLHEVNKHIDEYIDVWSA
jgi:hypothetical protein